MVDVNRIISIIAVAIAGINMLVTIAYSYYTRRSDRQHKSRELLSESMQEKEKLLSRTEQQYTEVQDCVNQLALFTMQHPNGSLWDALQITPAASSPAPFETHQRLIALQLQDEQQRVWLRLDRARYIAKQFWEQFYENIHSGKLPEDFGRDRRSNRVDFIDRRKPDDFDYRWLHRSDNYRRIVEPFDIANYYRMGLDRNGGDSYIDGGRPSIYTNLEIIAENANIAYYDTLIWAKIIDGSYPPHGSATDPSASSPTRLCRMPTSNTASAPP